MNGLYKYTFMLGVGLLMISCVATNNLYLNNPVPMGAGIGEVYIGIGTGVTAKVDSISSGNGEIYFSDKISVSPILSLGGQLGLFKQTDFRFDFHLPSIVGGIGLRLGVQQSFFDSNSRINLALGTDLGVVYAFDSLVLRINTNEIRTTNSAINADIFMPISFKTKNDFSVVLTPRYTINTMYIRKHQGESSAEPFHLNYPVLSLGVWIHKFYFEASTLYYDRVVYPQFGVAWMVYKR